MGGKAEVVQATEWCRRERGKGTQVRSEGVASGVAGRTVLLHSWICRWADWRQRLGKMGKTSV